MQNAINVMNFELPVTKVPGIVSYDYIEPSLLKQEHCF